MISLLLIAGGARADDSIGKPFEVKSSPQAGGEDPVDRLLRQSRMTHEPDAQIREAVALLDGRLDAQPRDKQLWLKLGEALAIGFAKSKHARSALDAWRKAGELDPADCHVAALVARDEQYDDGVAFHSRTGDAWQSRADACAEMLYVLSMRDRAHEIDLLERARKLAARSEPLVALGVARLRKQQLKAAEEAFKAALAADADAFPEDWRVDGWRAVHANLGLAIIYTKTHQKDKAKECLEALHSYLDDPGPWHDFSKEEKAWARATLHQTLY
jgi:tetratricopeptide (TPR) repeat protein